MSIVFRVKSWILLPLLLGGIGPVLLSGCGGPRIHHVNPEIARQTLTQALDQWKAGESPESLRKRQPEIVVQDFDWLRGAKLSEYELQGDGEARDANLAIKVKLTLIDANGKESTKVVAYLVGTSPVLTVFRDMF